MRLEYKYVVPASRLDELRADIMPFMEYDKYAARCEGGQYTVRSIYFDTPRFDCYREKVEGIMIRKKVRLRAYNTRTEDSIAFLEIKKKVDQRGMKNRSAVRISDVVELFATKDVRRFVVPGKEAERSFDDAQRFFFQLEYRMMNPVILVTYEREAFQGRVSPDLRITFDKQLRYQSLPSLNDLYEEDGLRRVAPRFFILEIKFDRGYAPWLQRLVGKYDLQHQRVSKYVSTLDACKAMRPFLATRFFTRAEFHERRVNAEELA